MYFVLVVEEALFITGTKYFKNMYNVFGSVCTVQGVASP
jgi:hypothetical protein